MLSYLVPEGLLQPTLKGRQWRHGVVYWMFMVAGLIDSAEHTSVGPSSAAWIAYTSKMRRGLRKVKATKGEEAALDDDLDSQSEEDGDEIGDEGAELSAYQKAFGTRAPKEAVLEVACRTALLMGKLCGDNIPEDADMTDDEARSLSREAYKLVTKYMAALFGPTHTTKMHRLAYHLHDELVLRGNLVDADTSVNEMMHKQCTIMYERSNKSVDHFLLQMLRAEQTLAFVAAEDDAHDVLRAADLLGSSDDLLDATAAGQLTTERNIMDGATEPPFVCGEDHQRGGHSRQCATDNCSGNILCSAPCAVRGRDRRDRESGEGLEQHTRGQKRRLGGVLVHRPNPEGDVTGTHGCVRHGLRNEQCNRALEGTRDEARCLAPGQAHGDVRIRARGQARGHAHSQSAPAYGLRVSVGDVEAKHGGELCALGELLQLRRSQLLTIANSLTFNATFSWRKTGRMQHVRASDDLYRSPWWDHVVYKDEVTGEIRHGRACLIIKGIDTAPRVLLVVQRMVRAEAQQRCVLTHFGCTRLRWDMDDRTGFPALHAVRVENLVRLEHIVPDFEDLCNRHGLFSNPGNTPRTKTERVAERYWVNIFFPWTSNGFQDKTA